ncbi:hypothetical protein [Brachybacterium sacelli]|uniref:hypothetical protein n=1 Tax=Brachybacterium sacelli TaxID=173364 RepID=UPI003607C21A
MADQERSDVLQHNLRTPGPWTDPTNVDDRASSGHPRPGRMPRDLPSRWHNDLHDDAFTDPRG